MDDINFVDDHESGKVCGCYIFIWPQTRYNRILEALSLALVNGRTRFNLDLI